MTQGCKQVKSRLQSTQINKTSKLDEHFNIFKQLLHFVADLLIPLLPFLLLQSFQFIILLLLLYLNRIFQLIKQDLSKKKIPNFSLAE